jgi:Ca2+-binding EF-hand superfamily protein
MKKPLVSLCSMAGLLITAATAQAQASAAAPVPGQPPTEAATTFQRWDKNNDKTLSAAEFAAGWQEIQAANTLRNLHDNFVAKDADRNGSLGPAEYLKLDLIQKAGPSAPPMATFDTDKNQSLDFKEYVGMVGALIKSDP